ncbi:MAG: anaerobic ribonucleoside-triphosphate reductase activating protein [Candidatus Pacearchaeota archaeon]|nr:anaerobic ribonucleoside-triphosphate reductase activating protein [Candidatus Pacearchaeota archaeon]
MRISDFQRETLSDYPGKISSIVFIRGCNYRCPTCHAKQIIEMKKELDEEIIFDYIEPRKDWIEGVVICGGEPTRRGDLKYFIRKIKEKGLAVKLDTNGSNFNALENLREEKLIDYVAMDVKGPMSLYAKLVGKDFVDERDEIIKGIGAVSLFPDYEFRTTVVPLYEDSKVRWMTPKEIGETAKMICDYTGYKFHKFFLQKFIARDKNEMIDKKFARENLPEEFLKTPKRLLDECLIEAKKYLPNTKIR